MAETNTSVDDTEMAMVQPKFIHLRIHSAFSLLEGALPVAKIIKFAEAEKCPAIVPRNTLFEPLSEFSPAEYPKKVLLFPLEINPVLPPINVLFDPVD